MAALAQTKKLTVQVDARWLEHAKTYAAKHGTSLSTLVSEFLRGLADEQTVTSTPVLQRLSGILPVDASAGSYESYLDQKYG
jgi:hypothetical protein